MNQSNASWYHKCGQWLPYVILLGWFCLISTLFAFIVISRDFEALYYIPGSSIFDWHSPLLWKQLQLFDQITPGDYNAANAGQFFIALWLFALLFACVLITRLLVRENKSPYWFIACVVLIVNPWCFDTFFVSLDMAAAYLMSAVLALACAFDQRHSLLRFGLLILLILYVTMHRSNAILTAPILCFYACGALGGNQWSLVKRCGAALGCTVLIALSTYAINYHVIEAKRTFPENVMLQSDIYCMDILEGKEPCRSSFERIGTDYRATDKRIQARFALVAPPGDFAQLRRENAIWKEEWWKKVSEAPAAFLTVRGVLLCKFLMQGACPEWLERYVRSTYPESGAIVASEATWGCPIVPQELALLIEKKLLPPQLSRFIYTGTYLLSLVLLPFVYLRHRKAWQGSRIFRLSVMAFCLSVTYTASLLVFIPTPDSRYMAPSFVFWAFALGAWMTYRKAQPPAATEN